MMRAKPFRAAALVALGLLMASGSCALAAESISSFDASVAILPDAAVRVTEQITYDFGDEHRHGIYRVIPRRYATQLGSRSIAFTIDEVLRDGKAEPYDSSRQGDSTRIKIGDPDVTITGAHTYTLSYRVDGAVNFFDDFDELYWNVTGDDWLLPIMAARVRVSLPAVVAPDRLEFACYQGAVRSREVCAWEYADGSFVASSTRPLAPNEGLTVAVGFPKGLVLEPTALEKGSNVVRDNLILLLPLFILGVMYGLWRRHGRDPKGRGTIIPEYEPPEGVRPTMIGTIIDGKVHHRDIVAGIVYLAEQGFIAIRYIEKSGWFGSDDYELTLQKPIESIPGAIEKLIANMLFVEAPQKKTSLLSFTSLMSDLFGTPVSSIDTADRPTIRLSQLKKNKHAAKALKGIKANVYDLLVTRGYYVDNPKKAQRLYVWIAGALAIVTFYVGDLLGFGVLGFISGFLSAGIIALFGLLMPRRTREGTRLKETIEGFRQFLSVTGQDRLAFHNPPKKTHTQFMQYLPFAIALEVEDEWAQQFEGMALDSPQWYVGPHGSFAPNAFAAEMSSFAAAASSGLSKSASSGGSGSGGGGFSGGGFGGGGGGSW